MYISLASVALLSVTTVSAFKDASPFLFFSTSELLFSSPQITTSSAVSESTLKGLSKCPSNIYVLAHQSGVSSEDFRAGSASPHLKEWASGKKQEIRSNFAVAEVVGDVELGSLQKVLEAECGAGTLNVDATTGLLDIASDSKPRVIKVDFPAPPSGEERGTALRQNDFFLSNLLDSIPTSDYTVVYTTSPGSGSQHSEGATSYDMGGHASLQGMELKRDLSARQNNGTNNGSLELVDGPLFEKYQYFTPAIFMGLITMAFLVSIGYFAVSAIGGLQVTYGAFEKDMSKQMQQQKQQ